MTEAALPVTSSFQARIDEYQASAKAARDSAQALKDQIDAVEKAVNDLMKKPSKRPEAGRRTLAEINRQIKEFENKQQHSSLSLKEEKEVVQKLKELSGAAKELTDFETFQESMSEKRAERDELWAKWKVANSLSKEISDKLSVLTMSAKIEILSEGKTVIQPEDLYRAEVEIHEDAAGTVIGKGGTNIARLQKDHMIAIDLEKSKGSGGAVKGLLIGQKANVEKAKKEIEEISEAHSAEPIFVALDEETVKKIDVRKLRQIQTDTGAYIQVGDSKDKKGSKNGIQIRGLKPAMAKAEKEVRELVRIAKLPEIVMELDASLVGQLIGKEGAQLKRMQEEHKVTIDIKKGDKNVVTIKGEQKGANACKAEIDAFIAENYKTEKVFDVSAEVMLVLLQRVSVTIVPAQESSGANIKLAKESNKIRVHGNAVQMAAAVPKVEQLIRDFGGEPIVIAVGEAEVALFLGKRSGETLRKLQDETGAYIDFVKEESCVKIRGKSSDADKAKKAIETLLDAERNAIDIEVDSDMIGTVIGKQGVRIIEMQKTFNVTMDIDKSNTGIKVKGAKDAVAKAKAAIEKFLEENKRDSVTIVVDPTILPMLIGKGGTVIAKLQADTGATIDINKGSNNLLIRGLVDAVAKAKAEVENFIEERSGDSQFVELEDEALKALIGKGGATIRKIQDDTKAYLDLDKEKKGVQIRGRTEAVAKAAAIVREMATTIANTISVSLGVDSKLVGRFIGKGGSGIAKLQEEYSVNIDVSKSDSKLTIRGLADPVNKAKDEIAALIEQYRREESEIAIDPDIIGRFVGKGGSNVIQIQKEHGVTIDVDKKTNTVRIKGKEDGVAAATAAISTFIEAYKAETSEMTVAKAHVLLLDGNTLREIQKATSTLLDIVKEKALIKMRGKEENIVEAKAKIQAIIDANPLESSEMEIADELIGRFIGKNGSNIERMANETGALIEVDRTKNVILMTGTVVALEKASDAVVDFLTRAGEDETWEPMPLVPSRGFSGGRGGGKGGNREPQQESVRIVAPQVAPRMDDFAAFAPLGSSAPAPAMQAPAGAWGKKPTLPARK